MYRRVNSELNRFILDAGSSNNNNFESSSSSNIIEPPKSVEISDNLQLDSDNSVSDSIPAHDFFFKPTDLLQDSDNEDPSQEQQQVTAKNQNNPNSDLKFDLKSWAISQKVTHCALTKLLHILKPYHSELPLDSRTLLSTPQCFNITELNTGSYIHLGLERAVRFFLEKYRNFNDNIINVSFNIDGIPLYKSSNIQAWPILGLIKNFNDQNPFAVGIFCGNSKPCPLDLYLDSFIRECNNLKEDGLLFENRRYSIVIHSFICDAPAKAFIKCIKSHSGYSSCDKCIEIGDYINGRVVLKNTNSAKRTNNSLREQLDEDHHVGISPLLNLDIDMVNIFPIDYMHNVCLGVMKKLLNSWVGGNLNVRLPTRLVTFISNRLVNCVSFIPGEINRKPRPLSELPKFKATEFRTFLLYTGIVVLKDIVSAPIYNHFLLFHTGIILLMSENNLSREKNCENSKRIFETFISHGQKLYGPEFPIYNIHVLSHLPDDVLKFGSLDSFSAFPFENYLGNIKSLVRSSTKPLQQICRRIIELESVNTCTILNHEVKLEFEHYNGPCSSNQLSKKFRKLSLKNNFFTIHSYSKADSYCFTNAYVIQIENLIRENNDNNEIKIIGRYFTSCDSYYDYPFDSSDLHIHLVSGLTNFTKTWHISEIIGKCMLLPYQDNFVSIPLFHTCKV
ncbi:unnamed protein product [Ceutorhynchus assimilis]|uniref:Transposase domain-containing protein n=1 Tax=Ceutorhynchus assimilis TaxID=467358 RepID=A0A9N9QRB5_9CUCU|nr:unnamed protein product [Ceutorhynchus assimilis]